MTLDNHTLAAQLRAGADYLDPPVPPPPPPPSAVVDQIVASMTGKHDGVPHGVPSNYDWQSGPVIRTDTTNLLKGNTINPWFQAYLTADNTLDMTKSNTRIALGKLQGSVLTGAVGANDAATDVWKLSVVHDAGSSLQGAAYLEDFSGGTNVTIAKRTEADGSQSAQLISGHNWHGWDGQWPVPSDPAPNDKYVSGTLKGIWVSLDARLVPNDPTKPDDRAYWSTHCMVGLGVDYKVGWGTVLGDGGISKMRKLTNDWQTIHLYAILTEAQLRANPPVK